MRQLPGLKLNTAQSLFYTYRVLSAIEIILCAIRHYARKTDHGKNTNFTFWSP